jgi:sterol desaturase/sphingolipid hydroxylase (fatty acid hydroxylase superfamily)
MGSTRKKNRNTKVSNYLKIITDSYQGYANYLLKEVLSPSWHNYFYWLIGISLIVWLLEIALPWRTNQNPVRKDFWMDAFYMFFNFFIFSLVGFNALSNVAVTAFNDFLALCGIHNLVAIQLATLPQWAKLLTMFIIADFIQWNIHRLLHKVDWLWQFHKVHHSVQEMGFAAHLRYHFMENIIYKTLQYIPLAMLGFGLQDFIIIHIISITIGHLNHSNLKITYGPFKYLLNNPVMHLWHHAKEIPEGKTGVNFGLSLSIWDYLFGTAYIPTQDGKTQLGFEGVEKYPTTFLAQIIKPFRKP